MDVSYPAYVASYREGILEARCAEAASLMSPCRLCARQCGVDRAGGDLGRCRQGVEARVASAFLHHGEEPVISGFLGSGTVFLSGCPLGCVFCQNYETSHGCEGIYLSTSEFAELLLRLVSAGCHNLNFVTPSHFMPQILMALATLAERCDRPDMPPVVWNCGGYESTEALALLEGIVDIYMPDLKTMDAEASSRWFHAPDYGQVVVSALEEMYRQVGAVQFDRLGLLRRGLLVRHLVMPGMLDDTKRILSYLASAFGDSILVNVMGQYRPCGEAWQYPDLARPLHLSEWQEALRYAHSLSLRLA